MATTTFTESPTVPTGDHGLPTTKELTAALLGTLSLIRKAQERLSSHLTPDSNGDDAECLNDLLYMFDGPEQRKIEADARMALSNAERAS